MFFSSLLTFQMLSIQQAKLLLLRLMIKRFMATPEHDRKEVERKYKVEQIMKLDILLIDCQLSKKENN
jgi:hypothetical protein